MSCGGEREHMEAWAQKKLRSGAAAFDAYVAEKNAASIDGLPAFDAVGPPPEA